MIESSPGNETVPPPRKVSRQQSVSTQHGIGSIKGTGFMPANRPEFPIANIFSPRFPHEPIDIIGNKAGLERLINILIDAVGESQAKAPIFTSDGFDSEVRAICLQGERRPEEWRRAGSPHWDVDDPRVARIVDLTQENARLRRVIAQLRRERKSITKVDYLGGTEAMDVGQP
jgi:hypothetical protein